LIRREEHVMDRCASKSLIAALIALIVMSGSVTAGPVPTAADRSAKASESARGGPLQSRDREGAVLPTPIGHPPSESVPLGEAVHEPAPDLDAPGRPAARPTDRVWYVDSRAPGANDGTSWENAFHDLHDALAVARNGDEVRVAQGVYRPAAPNGNRNVYYRVRVSVVLRGGFSGVGGDDPDEHDPTRFETIISGDLNGDDGPEFTNRSDNTWLLTAVTGDATARIEGFIFESAGPGIPQRGVSTDPTASSPSEGAGQMQEVTTNSGGGIYTNAALLEVRRCTFRRNSRTPGAGISATNDLVVEDCVFVDNLAVWPSALGGVAIYAEEIYGRHSLEIRRCRFENSRAWSPYGPSPLHTASGGAVAVSGYGRVTIEDSVFKNNALGGAGGGLLVLASTRAPLHADIARCTFEANQSADEGGAAFLSGGELYARIVGCEFIKNHAPYHGALRVSHNGPPEQVLVVDSLFDGNTATYVCGAAFAEATFSGCVFHANAAENGGALCTVGEVVDCVFIENYAGDAGALSATRPVERCLFVGNVAAGGRGGAIHGLSRGARACVFHDNKAWRGGAVALCAGEEYSLESCLFVGNRASEAGSAIYSTCGGYTMSNLTVVGNIGADGVTAIHLSGEEPLAITDSILWGNRGGNFSAADPDLLDVSYSLVEGGWPGEGNIDVDPRFVDPGGVTPDFRLRPDSPAINTGDPDRVLTEGERDLDGHPRVLCDRVDMGAYEFGAGDHNCDRAIDLDDFAAWTPCVTGPAGGPYNPGCEALDFDFDGDVDTADFAGFQVALPR
jgi:hypothetical protein